MRMIWSTEHRHGVSSHAPARGATSSRSAPCYHHRCFKSCPREGGNLTAKSVEVCVKAFQVMPPRGGQPGVGIPEVFDERSFKSCPREGGNLL